MTTIKDILEYFEEFAPVDTAMDFDNCGLLIGDKNKPVSRVLVALDITNEVVDEADRLGAELIISHHPVIFNAIKKLNSNSVPYRLAQKNISAVCMHTNLDVSNTFGVNLCLANAVGLKNTKLCSSGECLFIGELDTDIESFAKAVKTALDCNGLRYTDVKSEIHKVAVSSGAGGSNIAEAFYEGADVLLTGEIKHHEILLANELGISVVDAGHFKTEDIVINPLCRKLSERFGNIVFTKSAVCNDKIKYI